MITKPIIPDITAGLILILPLMLITAVSIHSWQFFAGYVATTLFVYAINGDRKE